MKRFFTICLMILIGQNINAQIITDRPDQTESSFTVGAANFQIESGITVGSDYEERNQLITFTHPSTLLRVGLTKNIELRLVTELNSSLKTDVPKTGFSDLEVGTKIHLFSTEKSAMAIISHLSLPTGDPQYSEGQNGMSHLLAVSHELTDRMALGYNLGFSKIKQQPSIFTYAFSLGIGINDKVGVYIEPYGTMQSTKQYEINADAGFTYLLHKNLQADFSFGTGLSHQMNYKSLGISWLIQN